MDDISGRLREGCPSYYKESDYKFYLAVECLERAAAASNNDERETLARDAFSKLSGVPESADLQTVCKRFEDLRCVSLMKLNSWGVMSWLGMGQNDFFLPGEPKIFLTNF